MLANDVAAVCCVHQVISMLDTLLCDESQGSGYLAVMNRGTCNDDANGKATNVAQRFVNAEPFNQTYSAGNT